MTTAPSRIPQPQGVGVRKRDEGRRGLALLCRAVGRKGDMAGRRRSRQSGEGMTPMFDVEAYARRDDRRPATARHERGHDAAKASARATVAIATPVEYWVRGVFRVGDGQMTRTVPAIGMSTRLDDDMAKFVRYLTDEGFQFPEGRAVLIELLGTGTDGSSSPPNPLSIA